METANNTFANITNKVANYFTETVKETYQKITHPKQTMIDFYKEALKEGPYFAAYAVAVEITEDIILPPIFIANGHPEIAAGLLAFHTEPIMYPLYFGARKLYKHLTQEKKNYFLPMRTQPPHKGHISMIEAACQEADHVTIGVGSANAKGQKNPYTADERQAMLDYSLKEKGIKNYSFVTLYDFDNDEDWFQDTTRHMKKGDTIITGNDWVTDIFTERGFKAKRPEEIIKQENLVDICATELRNKIINDDNTWKDYAAQGTIKYFEEFGGKERIAKYFN